ncbi:hypothetical protein Tco_0862887 [Tanacetum coccineum]
MNQSITQQVVLDEALVSTDDRVTIGSCNMIIDPTKTQKEPTYQVVLDVLKLSQCYNAFLITANFDNKKFKIGVELFHEILGICPRIPNKEFVAPPPHDAIVTFIKSLSYKGSWNFYLIYILITCINFGKHLLPSSIDVYLGRLRPWTGSDYQELKSCGACSIRRMSILLSCCRKTFSTKLTTDSPVLGDVKACLILNSPMSSSNTSFQNTKSISKRQGMFMNLIKHDDVLGRLKFVSKGEDNQVYGMSIPDVMVKDDIKKSKAYQTYLAISTRVVSLKTYLAISTRVVILKKARKGIKTPATPKKNVTEKPTRDESDDKEEGRLTRRRPSSVVIRDNPNVSTKKTLDQYKKLKGMEILSDAGQLAADTQKAIKASKKSYRLQQQTKGSSEGAGITPKVPDEPKEKSKGSSKGAGITPKVPDELKGKFVAQFDDQGSDEEEEIISIDDEETESKNEVAESEADEETIDDDEELHEDEYAHNDDDEKHDDADDEMNDDELKDDQEMADAEKVDYEKTEKEKVDSEQARVEQAAKDDQA